VRGERNKEIDGIIDEENVVLLQRVLNPSPQHMTWS
jgi:hypothetical protein